MEQIRVLQIGMHDNLGGVENFIMNYYRNIDRKVIQFDFINIYDKICYEKEIKQLGGKIYNISNAKKNPFKYYKQLKKILTKNKYEIIHINLLSFANILPILAAKRVGVPNIILHSHNGGVPKGKLRKVLNKINQKFILKNKKFKLWACSELAGKWMFGENTFRVIDNAIDTKKFEFNEEKRKNKRKELKINNNFVIGHVGRFQEQKNHEFLIDVFSEIYKKRHDAVLLLIGVGELQDKIQKKINQMHLEKNVKMLGAIKDIADYYQTMDIFLLPSLFEGFPIVAIEAQCAGLLCVLSKNITKEAKILSSTNFISLDETKEQWAQKILKLYENYNRNSILNKNEIERYNIKNKAKELQELYIQMKKGAV